VVGTYGIWEFAEYDGRLAAGNLKQAEFSTGLLLIKQRAIWWINTGIPGACLPNA
jgi:hypothetical protein